MHVHFLTPSLLHVSEKEMSDRSDLQQLKFDAGIHIVRRGSLGSKPFGRDVLDTRGVV